MVINQSTVRDSMIMNACELIHNSVDFTNEVQCEKGLFETMFII